MNCVINFGLPANKRGNGHLFFILADTEYRFHSFVSRLIGLWSKYLVDFRDEKPTDGICCFFRDSPP